MIEIGISFAGSGRFDHLRRPCYTADNADGSFSIRTSK